MDTSQTAASFEEQGSFRKNQLRSLVPTWNIGFYTWTLKNSVSIPFPCIWTFFESTVCLRVSYTHENAYSWRFHFKVKGKNIGSFEKRYQGFFMR